MILFCFFFLVIREPPRSTLSSSSAASDVYKRQLLKQYRNYGIGTNLMEQMLKKLKMQGYKQVSLSVQKMNYAVHMYLKVGFEIVDENDEEYIMICKL